MHLVKFIIEHYKDKLTGLSSLVSDLTLKELLMGLDFSGATDYEKGQWFINLLAQMDPRGLLTPYMFDVEVKRDGTSLMISADYKELYPTSLFSYTLFLYDEFDIGVEFDDPTPSDTVLSKLWIYAPPLGDQDADAIETELDLDQSLPIQIVPKLEMDRDTILGFAKDNAHQFHECLGMISRSGSRLWFPSVQTRG